LSLLGIHLTLLIGPQAPLPAPPLLTASLDQVEVETSDEGPSAFQIVFKAGRSSFLGVLDEPLLASPLLRPFNRVILILTMNVTPRVLLDGIITHVEHDPGEEVGGGSVTITGTDVSVMMDLEEVTAEHPSQPDQAVVTKLILKYAKYGLVPTVVAPKVNHIPVPVERVPVQTDTDYGHLEKLARRHGYVFYLTPGPAPYVNQAYWGPPKRVGLPQPALSVDFGTRTNVRRINFRHDALAPTRVEGYVQDARTNQLVPVQTFFPTRLPLTVQPTFLVHAADVRTKQFRRSGLQAAVAQGEAQGETDGSADKVVVASGELDGLRYGDVLQARGLVGLRGAGFSYDGLYYVKQVSHTISRGDYSQSFTLTRDGVGSTTAFVRP
jgi:hypothetical protein